jgi:DNA-binding GntR family transcriptional regulator
MTRADTLATQAYQTIRMALFTADLKPDVFYSENSIAVMLGISRTPAREALRQLESEGLIEVLPQRGFRLRRLGPAELTEFYELRGMLESYVVRTLCTIIDDGGVQQLEHILDRQTHASHNVADFINLDEEFHLSMARMAGLERTARIVGSLRGVLWLMGARMVGDSPRRADVLYEHTTILSALERRDPEAAAQAVVKHIAATARMALAQEDSQTQTLAPTTAAGSSRSAAS